MTVRERRAGRRPLRTSNPPWSSLLRRFPDANLELPKQLVMPLPTTGTTARIAMLAWSALADTLCVKVGLDARRRPFVEFDYPLVRTLEAALTNVDSTMAETVLFNTFATPKLVDTARDHVREVLVSYRDRGCSTYGPVSSALGARR